MSNAIGSHNSSRYVEDRKFVTAWIGDQLFAIPIEQVQDIVEPQKITFVPRAHESVRGLLNLRGKIVTVLSLRFCLGLSLEDLTNPLLGVTVNFEGDDYTLLVDRIGDVLEVSSKQINPAPHNLGERLSDVCTGIIQLDDKLVAVLDIPMFMNFNFPTQRASTTKQFSRWTQLISETADGFSL